MINASGTYRQKTTPSAPTSAMRKNTPRTAGGYSGSDKEYAHKYTSPKMTPAMTMPPATSSIMDTSVSFFLRSPAFSVPAQGTCKKYTQLVRFGNSDAAT